METHIITPADYIEKADLLEQYHKLRHDIFVSLSGLGRQDLYSAAGQETDIWDLPHFNPAHFLVTHEGQPIAVARMTSAARPTMMHVLYDRFVDGEVPQRADLWEVQRVGVDLTQPALLREIALLNILIAMHKYAERVGGRDLMLLTFEGIASKRLGDMTPMGPVDTHIGFPHVALIGDLKAETVPEWRADLSRLEDKLKTEKAA